jgi:hypothetical protein
LKFESQFVHFFENIKKKILYFSIHQICTQFFVIRFSASIRLRPPGLLRRDEVQPLLRTTST